MDIKIEPDDDYYGNMDTGFMNIHMQTSRLPDDYSSGPNKTQPPWPRDIDVSENRINDSISIKEELMEVKTEGANHEWSQYKVNFYDDLAYDNGECSNMERPENTEENSNRFCIREAVKSEFDECDRFQTSTDGVVNSTLLIPKVEFDEAAGGDVLFGSDDPKDDIPYNDLTFMGKTIRQIILDSESTARVELQKIRVFTRNFVCIVCYLNFKSKKLLKNHKIVFGHFQFDKIKLKKLNRMIVSQKRCIATSDIYAIDKDIKLFECDVCSYKCKANNSLTRHKIIHSNEKPFKCEFCTAEFRQACHLKSHKLIHTNVNPFSCDECTLQFRNSSNLKRHKMCHKNERPYKCEKCPSVFRQMCHLRAHEMIHDELFPLTCEVCQLKFRKLGNLKRHQLQHTDLNKTPTIFQCDECDSKFKQNAQLKMHKLIAHPNDKPLVRCSVCHLIFTSEGNLNRHKILTHEKPFECDICHCKFSSTVRLANHKANNCKPKAFKCDQCPSKFTRIGHLNLHKAIHSTDTPLHCELCTFKCRKKRDMKTHKSRHSSADLVPKLEHVEIS